METPQKSSGQKAKGILVGILKGIAGLAGVAFILAPLTGLGIAVMVGAGIVGALCLIGMTALDDTGHMFDSPDGSSGYWPKKPDK